MQSLRTSNQKALGVMLDESRVESFDCSEEFSFHHWIRVCELLSESEREVLPAEMAYSAGRTINPATRKSEVKSAAADEHLASHIV